MHEENVLSSWLRKNVESTEEKREKMNKEDNEEERKSGEQERWREKRRRKCSREGVCIRIPVMFFEEYSSMDESDSFGDSLGSPLRSFLWFLCACACGVSWCACCD